MRVAAGACLPEQLEEAPISSILLLVQVSSYRLALAACKLLALGGLVTLLSVQAATVIGLLRWSLRGGPLRGVSAFRL